MWCYIWFQSDLDRRTMHPKIWPNQIRTHDLWIMTGHFLQMRRFRPHSQQSVSVMFRVCVVITHVFYYVFGGVTHICLLCFWWCYSYLLIVSLVLLIFAYCVFGVTHICLLCLCCYSYLLIVSLVLLIYDCCVFAVTHICLLCLCCYSYLLVVSLLLLIFACCVFGVTHICLLCLWCYSFIGTHACLLHLWCYSFTFVVSWCHSFMFGVPLILRVHICWYVVEAWADIPCCLTPDHLYNFSFTKCNFTGWFPSPHRSYYQ